ncbi:MAG: hypothetical protein ACR2KZ_02895 [Segetibacter sp.]
MKKIPLLFLVVFALCGSTASAQGKSDMQAKQKEMMQQQDEMMQKQKEMMEKQKEMVQKQKEMMQKQKEMVVQQQAFAKEQKEMMNALKQEMLKDGLIPNEKNDELIIVNSREMLINGERKPDAIHRKYINLINSKRKKPFGDKEEWKFSID